MRLDLAVDKRKGVDILKFQDPSKHTKNIVQNGILRIDDQLKVKLKVELSRIALCSKKNIYSIENGFEVVLST